jgi:hypothetical protein
MKQTEMHSLKLPDAADNLESVEKIEIDGK